VTLNAFNLAFNCLSIPLFKAKPKNSRKTTHKLCVSKHPKQQKTEKPLIVRRIALGPNDGSHPWAVFALSPLVAARAARGEWQLVCPRAKAGGAQTAGGAVGWRFNHRQMGITLW
jgi:hypothetical protein